MLVTVIIPCYNVELYLKKCLESVLQQTYKDLEIIAIDNNSTDSTFFILKEYEKKYPQQIQVLKETKQGASAARNAGLYQAKGEWIQFLDADDYLEKNKIEHQIQLLQTCKHQPILVVGSFKYQVSKTKNLLFQPETHSPWLALLGGRLGNTCCNLWNTDILLKLDGWNIHQKSSQEYELMFRLLQVSEAVCYDFEANTQVIKREQSVSSTVTDNKNYRRAALQALKVYEYLKTAKPTFFQVHQLLICEQLLKHIVQIGFFDLTYAQQLHDEVIPQGFKIKDKGKGRIYKLFYNTMGFRKSINWMKKYLKIKSLFYENYWTYAHED